ncbi:BZ3500_MvSof-1268-A1-R1_Chr4-4g07494 [Microbotryum saponariae]|uniref:BZ3500_MvSof-1268-A1-R1_Chr4-4g07494 protein n=1 Tax=Microbotryum saponariae TaxID=289078 RepID=A0A2X0MD51_9BASI|nr:BZ3500_MvSof-1268-A1-R1_Chr4-4g07494 [Microbotryum saponariae]SDA07155.1 BZ3501_MvSof-1269-A2-R1_Chr4-3g07202 [Microbotryum saponariae]
MPLEHLKFRASKARRRQTEQPARILLPSQPSAAEREASTTDSTPLHADTLIN